jgi:hypothetical protein
MYVRVCICIRFRGNVFTERELYDCQSHEKVKYGHESRGTSHQGLHWRGPAATYPTDRTCLPNPCLTTVSFSSTIPIFRRHVTLFPSKGRSSQVAYRLTTISSSVRGRAFDVYECPREWQRNVILLSTLLYRFRRRSAFVPRGLVIALLYPTSPSLQLLVLSRHSSFFGGGTET